MSIVPFPTGRTRGSDPDPTPPTTPRARYVRCAKGVELQAAREAAEMTHEQAARRLLTVYNLRVPSRNAGRAPDDLSERDLRILPLKTREIARLERTSQDAYDRAVVDHAEYKKDPVWRPQKGWRPWPFLFDSFASTIALGHQDATVEELRAALQADADRRAAEKCAATRRRLGERAGTIAQLVWNHADDGAFLDRALVEELKGSDTRFTRWESFLVRSVLGVLADELRVVFPQRPAMEVVRWEDAA